MYVTARSVALRRTMRRLDPLRAVVAMGTDQYDLGRVIVGATPVATYDDGTFALYARHKDSELSRRGYPLDEVARWADLQAKACRRASACCVTTQWAARSMIDDYGVPKSRVHVVGMGHRPRSAPPGGRDWSVPRLLFVGIDWERKNGAAVVQAFSELRSSNPAATLDLVGDHPRIDVAGVTGHGFLPRGDRAAQARLDELFSRSTMFVLPGKFDPAGIAYLEAASAGLPVIATTEGGAGELLADGAITVNPENVHALVKAMRFLSDASNGQRLGGVAADRSAGSSWRGVSARILAALGIAVTP